MEGIQEIGVVARHESARTFKSGRIIVLLALYLLFSLLVLLVVGWIAQGASAQFHIDEAIKQDPEKAAEGLRQMRTGILSMFLDPDPALLDALAQIPLVVVIVFKIALFFLPAYVALMAYDQISGEIGPRSIRYLTVRARRSSVLLGKFLTQTLVLLTLTFVVNLAIFVYAKIANPEFTFGLMVLSLIKFWLASSVYALAYLALTMLCSSLFRQAALSLVFNFFALFAFFIVNFIGNFGVHRSLTPEGLLGPEEITSPISYVRFLTPSHYSTGLLHPQLKVLALSGAAYAGFTLIFLALAYLILRARDV